MAEREKRRATTFRTSRGAIVNVAAPQIYLSPGITEDQVKEALREELADVNKDVIEEKGLATAREQTWTTPTTVTSKTIFDLKKFYTTRLSALTPPATFPSFVTRPYFVDPDQYWTEDGYTLPAGYDAYLATYSRASLMYPFVGAYTKLPNMATLPTGSSIYIGLEQGGDSRMGIACFILKPISLEARYGAMLPYAVPMYITSMLPADYATVAHSYFVKLNKWGAEFFIDNRLVAIGLDIPESVVGVKATAPPYVIGITNTHVTKRMHTLLELMLPYAPGTLHPSLTLPLTPGYYRWVEDEPNPPRVRNLYDAGTNTLFAGLAIAAGSETSHPVPVFGYERKTLYFRANQAGTLLIEVLTQTGNWRTYDTLNVVANTLMPYVMTGSAVLARVTFTPSTYPCTVTEGEVVLH